MRCISACVVTHFYLFTPLYPSLTLPLFIPFLCSYLLANYSPPFCEKKLPLSARQSAYHLTNRVR